mgnify:FL=1
MNIADYSEHTVAMDKLVKEIKQALRDKRYARARTLMIEHMNHSAKLYAWIVWQLREYE